MESFTIGEAEYRKIIDHLEALRPLEGCGLVSGRKNAVYGIYPINNRLHSPVAYEMDPAQQLAAMLDIEEQGLELIAIYHSHPIGPATPSAIDVQQNYYPEAIQLIVSWSDQGQPIVRAFQISDDRITEIPIQFS